MTQTRHTILKPGEVTSFKFLDEQGLTFRVQHTVMGNSDRAYVYAAKGKRYASLQAYEGIGLARNNADGKRGNVLLLERPVPPIGRSGGLFEVFAINGF